MDEGLLPEPEKTGDGYPH
ncbi:hypothetical protein KIPB_017215, partial [Kipferlia bialata]|eukprot:g17215.t1